MSLTERARLAQELHDGIAQDLVGVGYHLDSILGSEDISLDVRQEVRAVRFKVTELLDSIRTEIHDLHEVTGNSFNSQLRHLASNLRSDLEVVLDISSNVTLFSDEGAYQVLRIARELLRNVEKHAHASKIEISLKTEGEFVRLLIKNDGVGRAEEITDSYGLRGSAQRALSIGGSLTWQKLENGFEAVISIPILDKAP